MRIGDDTRARGLLRAALACCALAALGAGAPAPAQTQEALDAARRLVVSSGLAVQLQAVPGQIQREVEQLRGKVPDETVNALGEASLKGFQPAGLQEDVSRVLAEKMPLADMRKIIAWLETDLGRRITRAEEQAAHQMTPESLRAHIEGTKRTPPSRKRAEMIAALMKATKAVESTANAIESIGLGVALGIDAMQPAQNRLGPANLRRRLREAMPPAQIRQEVSATLPAIFSFTYRDVSETDLAAYLAYSRSAIGVRYNDSVMGALAEALARAGVRVGQLVDEELKKKSA